MMAGVDDTPTLVTGRVVTPERVLDDGAVVIEGDRISWVGRRADLDDRSAELADDADEAHTILPGLVDVHCHGGAGGEFGADPDAGRTAARHHLAHGTTSLVGSLVSAPGPSLVAGVAACADLVAAGVLAGIHLEGPFLSVARCGAQDPTEAARTARTTTSAAASIGSCSQKRRTVHPAAVKRASVSRSRATLASSFCRHQSALSRYQRIV